jgi:hypothetical protein
MSQSIVFDGMRISGSSEIAALIRRQLGSAFLPGKSTDEGPEEAVWRLFHSIEGSPLEQDFLDAVMKLLIDDDPGIRTSAVGLAQDFAEKLEPSRLLAILDEHRALYDHVRPEGPAGHPTKNEKVLGRLRAAARDPAHGARVLAGLTISDRAWVLGNLGELIDKEPGRASIVLNNLPDATARLEFAKAASGISTRSRTAAVNAVREQVKDPEERKRLLSSLSAA